MGFQEGEQERNYSGFESKWNISFFCGPAIEEKPPVAAHAVC